MRWAHRCNGCGIFGLSRRVGHEEDIWRVLRECGKDGSQSLGPGRGGRGGGGGGCGRMILGFGQRWRPGSGIVVGKKTTDQKSDREEDYGSLFRVGRFS